MGCKDIPSEFDCVSALGQDTADAKFDEHWREFITENDLNEMLDYGLNTIRIPVGYWMFEDLVFRDSEHFPRGAFKHLKQICGWASDRGFYIILE
jgi:glucan endo-1,6-beta-glucosidase